MNREWMLQRLETFRKVIEAYQAEARRSADYSEKQRSLNEEATYQIPTVREILKRLESTLVPQIRPPHYLEAGSGSLDAVQQGIGILRDQDEWVANLAPDAPSLVADEFHPHAWSAASALWDTGQYRVAVGQATVSVSAHIAKRAGTSLSDRELVAQVFSPNAPSAQQVRLHLRGDKSSKIWKSRQDGLHLLAQGAFAGIRNVATHSAEEWSEQVALEHLAVLSVVARWSDETEVVTI